MDAADANDRGGPRRRRSRPGQYFDRTLEGAARPRPHLEQPLQNGRRCADTTGVELNELDFAEMLKFAGIAAVILFAVAWLLIRRS